MTDVPAPPRRSRLTPSDRALRSAVAALRREHRGWTFPPRLRVGTLAGSHVEVEAPTERRVDDALVADMVDALVERALVTEMLSTESAGDAWILRPGTPRDDVEDRRWLREVERAATARNLPIPRLWVITKSGGTDVRASRTLTWVRARTS